MSSITRSAVGGTIVARRIDFTPYLVGIGLGILSWIAFALAKEPLGITTALSRVGEPVAAAAIGEKAAASNAYWAPMPFAWDYGVLFLVGVLAGAFVSSLATGTLRIEAVPRFWRERFGPSVINPLSPPSSLARRSCTARGSREDVRAATASRAECNWRCRVGCSSS